MIDDGISGYLIDPALNLAVIFECVDPGVNSNKDFLK